MLGMLHIVKNFSGITAGLTINGIGLPLLYLVHRKLDESEKQAVQTALKVRRDSKKNDDAELSLEDKMKKRK
jgi:hypothetical protein